MKAVYIKEFGDLSNLEFREVDDPAEPSANAVLVHVRAAGLNRADLLQVKGMYPPPAGYSPNIPGLEFAGEVLSIGPDVMGWKSDDRVFGITAGEAQAEQLLIDASLLARIPDDMPFPEAAAVPEAFVTAYDAIITQASLAAGDILVIHAVGSGVGLAALQIAKALGAKVVGTSRTSEKLEKCVGLGLDHAIVADNADFADQVLDLTEGHGADVILDLVGADYFTDNLKCVANKGRIMLVGLTSGATAELDMRLALQKRLTIKGTVLRPRSISEKADAIERFSKEVLPLLADGTIQPNLDRAYPAGDVVEAYKYLASNKSFGKVVLEF